MPDRSSKVELAYRLANCEIDKSFTPILDSVADIYGTHHSDYGLSLYAIGSMVYGGFRPTVSDIDIIGITGKQDAIDEAADSARKADIQTLSNQHPQIAYIDNVLVAKNALLIADVRGTSQVSGYLAKLSLTGVCFAGESIDFSPYIPSRDEMIFGRVERVKSLMQKYQAGNLIEPFKRDKRLLVRSCAKAAMRVMSSLVLLEGAAYHPAPSWVAVDIAHLLPDLSDQTAAILHVIDEPHTDTDDAFLMVDMALNTFEAYNKAHEGQGPSIHSG